MDITVDQVESAKHSLFVCQHSVRDESHLQVFMISFTLQQLLLLLFHNVTLLDLLDLTAPLMPHTVRTAVSATSFCSPSASCQSATGGSKLCSLKSGLR
jgi:hypothetical protein